MASTINHVNHGPRYNDSPHNKSAFTDITPVSDTKEVVYGPPKKKRKRHLTGLATLSIKQPAAALILYRGKDVENRSQSKFKGGGKEFNAQSRWVLIQTGQTRQKPEPTLSTLQINAASVFQNKEFEDTAYFEPNYGKEFYTTASKNQ